MLRQQVGDEAFFAALNRYLKKNEYTDVEAAELRLAFEDVTGQDLQWFFNQWFLGAGHPVLDISYGWDETTKKASVNIVQSQEGKGVARVFDLPLAVDIYDNTGKAVRKNIRVTQRKQTFTFDAPALPALINVDATKTLLCVKTDQPHAGRMGFPVPQRPAFPRSLGSAGNSQAEQTDARPRNRKRSIKRQISGHPTQSAWLLTSTILVPGVIEKMAGWRPRSSGPGVLAIGILAEIGDKKYVPLFEKGMGEDQPYSVVGFRLGHGLEQNRS